METIRIVHINENLESNSSPNRIKIGVNGLRCGVIAKKYIKIYRRICKDSLD